MKRSVLLLVFCAVLGWAQVEAATVNAASCSSTAIQAAITTAVDGDTVAIPAGTCTISTQITANETLTIQGAGASGATQTVLTSGLTGAEQGLMQFSCSGGKTYKVTGIRFEGQNSSTIGDVGLRLNNGCIDFRIYQNAFNNFGVAGVYTNNGGRGLVDHNTFAGNFTNYQGNWGYSVVIFGDGTYPATMPTLGTQNAVFVEDNTFTGCRHCIAANGGANYVFRYNTITGMAISVGAIDAHGEDGTRVHGTRTWEIYENFVDNADFGHTLFYTGVFVFGGDGVIFNNQLNDNSQQSIYLSSQIGSPWCPSPYPMAGQIREAYIWNNNYNPVPAVPIRVSTECVNHIVLNRDYFLIPRPGYTAFTYPHPLITGAAGPPPAPTGLTVVPVIPASPSKLSASWIASTGATGYKIYECHSGGSCTPTTPYGDVGNVTSATLRGLFGNTGYRVCVTAYDATAAESACSTPAPATSVNTAPIPANSPEVLFSFEEGAGGNVFDDSGHGHNSSTHTGTFSTPGHNGTFAGTYSGSQSTRFPNTVELRPAAVTLTTWVRRVGVQPSAAPILRKTFNNNGSAPWTSYNLVLNPDGLGTALGGCELGRTDTDTVVSSTAAGAIPDVTWVHLVCVFDPAAGINQQRMYVNGALSGTPVTNALGLLYDTTTTGDLFMGGETGAGFLTGSVDDVRMYPRVLSQAEINMLAGIPPAVPVGLSVSAASPASPSRLSLTWTANSESTLAGYKVYECSGAACTPAVLRQDVGLLTTLLARGLLGNTLYRYCLTAYDTEAQASACSSPSTAVSTATMAAGSPEFRLGFEEGGGTTLYDESGHGHNSTASSTVFSATAHDGSWSGNFTGALSTRIPRTYTGESPIGFEPTAVTMMAWVRRAITEPSGTVLWRKAWQGGAGPTYSSYNLNLNPGGTDTTAAGCEIGISGNFIVIASATNAIPDTTTWVHVACTYDPSGGTQTHKLYINGNPSGTTGNATNPIAYDTSAAPSTGDIWIGQNGMGGQFYTGLLDEVRMYRVALTQTEIQTAAGLSGDVTAPAAPANLRVVSP